jgi:hypothetical protein
VGAPIPETQNFSRETARLKGQLTGKGTKRSREDGEDVKKDKPESSDDEESRAGAIKKKVRLDPFGEGSGKKKRKKQMAPNDSTGSSHAPPSVTDTESLEQAEVIGMVTEVDTTNGRDAVMSPPQPSIHNSSAKQYVDEIQAPAPTSSNSFDKANRDTPEKSTGKHLSSCYYRSIYQLFPTAKDFPPRSPNALQVVDISLTATPVLPPSRRSLLSHSPEILKQPVLNLDPPSSDDNSDQEAGPEASPALSPKKKRKRRKKKKKHSQLTDVTTTAKSNGNV